MAFTSPSYWTLKRKAKALVDEKLQSVHTQGLDCWDSQTDTPAEGFEDCQLGQLVPSQCTPTERILLQMLGELQSQVQHMTEIVTQIPTLLGNNPGNAPLTTCAEDGRFPLQDTEDLNNVEMQLENVEFKNKLVSKLSLAGGQTLKKTVWRICGKVFDPQLAVHLNWCGRRGKTPMKNTKIVNVIIQSALRNPLVSSPNEAEIEKTIKEWLRLSRDRLSRRVR
ncbi:uncharacterized protein [Paramormyrops kingsleyae]|uniref:uncharacterized protein n=1 Tax=Paramormyrops kingsleyae TaxID=1676925 RepID=UPI003B96F4CC